MTEAQENYRRVLDEESARFPDGPERKDAPGLAESVRRILAAREGLTWEEEGEVYRARLLAGMGTK